MGFKPFPRTTGDWEQAILRSALVADFTLLTVQLWAKVSLSGGVQQYIEEMLSVPALLLSFFLVCCSVLALLQRRRLLSLMAAVVGILSTIIALLPILSQEGIRN